MAAHVMRALWPCEVRGRVSKARRTCAQVYRAETDLPKSLSFLDADLTKDPAADLEAAEK